MLCFAQTQAIKTFGHRLLSIHLDRCCHPIVDLLYGHHEIMSQRIKSAGFSTAHGRSQMATADIQMVMLSRTQEHKNCTMSLMVKGYQQYPSCAYLCLSSPTAPGYVPAEQQHKESHASWMHCRLAGRVLSKARYAHHLVKPCQLQQLSCCCIMPSPACMQ